MEKQMTGQEPIIDNHPPDGFEIAAFKPEKPLPADSKIKCTTLAGNQKAQP